MSLVFDCGSSTTKLGFSRNNAPLAYEPSMVAGDFTALDCGGSTFHFGRSAARLEDSRSFIRNGFVSGWCDWEGFMQSCFTEVLCVDPRDYPLVLSAPPLSPWGYRGRLAESAFEVFDSPSIAVESQPVLALYALGGEGAPTGVVVDAGETGVSVVPVVDGYVVGGGVRRSPVGGAAVTGIFSEALTARGELAGWNAGGRDLLEISKKVKEASAFVSQDPLKEEFTKWVELGSSVKVEVGFEAFLGPEIYFESEISGHSPVLPAVVAESVSLCPLDYRKKLFSNIFLCGGGASMPGFRSRLKSELKRGVSKGSEVVVSSDLEISKFAVWAGAAILAETKGFSKRVLTKKEYFENGAFRFETLADD